jgi:hypothetical protein
MNKNPGTRIINEAIQIVKTHDRLIDSYQNMLVIPFFNYVKSQWFLTDLVYSKSKSDYEHEMVSLILKKMLTECLLNYYSSNQFIEGPFFSKYSKVPFSIPNCECLPLKLFFTEDLFVVPFNYSNYWFSVPNTKISSKIIFVENHRVLSIVINFGILYSVKFNKNINKLTLVESNKIYESKLNITFR